MGRYFQLPLSIVLVLFSILHSVEALGYVPTISNSGISIRWKAPFQLNLVGNSKNQSQLKASSFYQAVVSGLQRWQYASANVMKFDYWQGEDPKIYPPSSEYNGISSIYFASNSSTKLTLSPNVLGITQVWYNTDTGEILETDITLNDIDFHFTDNPKDTSGYGVGSVNLSEGKNRVYIQNVVTHELGHAMGLSHSGGLQSTMLFMESPEQAHLGCDELIAIRALYPSSDDQLRGHLMGRVQNEKGDPVFGAHVIAISQLRGTALATAISNRSGEFQFDALEPGEYFLMAEPFYAGPQALPSYYSSINPISCPEQTAFGRTFLSSSDAFTLTSMKVEAAKTTLSPPITIKCEQNGGAHVQETSATSLSSTVPTIFHSEATKGSAFGIVDKLSKANFNFYRLKGISGHLEIHALSYSLYSPIHSSLTLLDENGQVVNTQIWDPVYEGESGYINHDSALIADGLVKGDYFVKVMTHQLQANDYPAGPVSLDSVPFLILTGSLNGHSPDLISEIPANARCQIREEFPTYISPSSGPPQVTHSSSSSGGVGFCGTIENQKSGETENHAEFFAILGWFLPFLFAASVARVAIRLRTPSHAS